VDTDTSRENLLIWGDFSPSNSPRAMRRILIALAMLLSLVILLGLTLYGVSVYISSDINRISTETRELNERNKELQVSLNRIRSFRNVEETVRQHAHVAHLVEAEEVIEVPHSAIVPLPKPSQPEPRFPNAYGY
jgi:outer membrane murein-binding lipoprotein Lpp